MIAGRNPVMIAARVGTAGKAVGAERPRSPLAEDRRFKEFKAT